MRKFIKSVVLGVLALLLVFTFVACGNTNNGGGNNNGGTGGNNNGGTGENNNGGTGNNGQIEDGDFAYATYLITHEKDKQVTYVFEAENTDLSGKNGPDWSGRVDKENMPAEKTGASNNAVVRGLCGYGMTLNFIVVCDRDVDDAVLKLYLGSQYINAVIDSSTYMIRVDSCSDDDLKSTDEGGAVGAWDVAFLNYYKDKNLVQEITSWECGNISIDKPAQRGEIALGAADGYLITNSLKLKKGVNSISLVTNNSYVEEEPHGTLTATAPVVDCISITTTAQMGMYINVDNGYGKNGCKIK